MADDKNVEYDRRKKEKGLITHIVETFNGKQGRKVAFGLWLFWVANGFKAKLEMPWDIWFNCMVISALLVGFGTLLDAFLAKVSDAIVVIFADRASKIKSLTQTKEVPSDVATDAPKP